VQSTNRNSGCRRIALAAALSLGLATPILAQSWDASVPGATPSTFTPPSSASSDAEAKAAVSANRSDAAGGLAPAGLRYSTNVAPARSPAPIPSTTTAAPPVWNVSAPGTSAPQIPNNGERSIHEFGTGWKNFVNQKVMGVPPAPAAALSKPRTAPATPTARMEWNWQGYDTYNQRGNDVVAGGPSSQEGMHPDMAPYMKYAHLWRSSNNGFARPVAAGESPMPITQNESRAPSNWRSGTNFASAVPETNPVQPTSFATISTPTAADSLPQRPSQFPAPAEPPAGGIINGVPRSVRDSISAACQAKARNLVVELVAPMRLRVAFRVKQQADAEMLTEQLARLRDLAPYKVDFEVQIGQ